MSPLLALLLGSALRGALLGAIVWCGIKISRLADLATESCIWSLVLLVALAMPLAMTWLPGFVLPHFPAMNIASGASPVIGLALVSSAGEVSHQPSLLFWLLDHRALLVSYGYGAVALWGVSRILVGLWLTLKLYREAAQVSEHWTDRCSVRISERLKSPISVGAAIILPLDYATWPQAKLSAVMAHERAHLRRGDFFIQLLAALHRAVFWFNPFAWWLEMKLSMLAEYASDEAAIDCLKDRPSYAELLVEVSCHAREPHRAATAMTRGPDIGWRVDRILGAPQQRVLSWGLRAAALASIMPVAGIMASAHASVIPRLEHKLPTLTAPILFHAVIAAASPHVPLITPTARPTSARTFRQARDAENEITYNPRALLDDPAATVLPTIIPLGHKASGDAVILSPDNN